jgi:AraC-like DNA-binding protein
LRRGADAYLTKPFSPQELCLRIDNLIELRNLMQARYKIANRPDEVMTLAPDPDSQFQHEDKFMTDLRAFLAANLNDPDLNVAKIATHFGVSRTQLYRKLASLTDAGVADLIRGARCERALELIRQQELNLSEIAYEVGYSSPSHFSRSFKQQFGLAPSEVLRKA